MSAFPCRAKADCSRYSTSAPQPRTAHPGKDARSDHGPCGDGRSCREINGCVGSAGVFVVASLVSPLSGIPGLSSLGGLTIALIALQILLGRQTIWLPDFVLRRQVSAERLQRALARLDRAAAFVDRRSVTRAEWIFAFPGRQLALTTCLLCGLAMPFLELVPFSATTLALVVSILASALLVRDGVLAALGLGSFGLAVFIITKLATT